MKIIGKFDFKVEGDNVDFTGKMTLPNFMRMLLHCASMNALENGFGLNKLLNEGVTWVLARMAIKLNRVPELFDEIYVKTWVSSLENTFSERQFAIYDRNDTLLGVATSMWAMIDINTRKAASIVHLEYMKDFVVDAGMDELMPQNDRVRCLEGEIISDRVVSYSDLDVNRHVNSAKYLEWVFDTISLDELEAEPMYGVLINYQYEVLHGDKISIRKSQKKELHYDVMKEDGVNAVKCRFYREPFVL